MRRRPDGYCNKCFAYIGSMNLLSVIMSRAVHEWLYKKNSINMNINFDFCYGCRELYIVRYRDLGTLLDKLKVLR